MIRKSYTMEIITPCFCGGAEPQEQAEIRSSTLRGQLRWWFRVLGGFSSLSASFNNLREQEAFIFGSAAGDSGTGGKLSVRIANGPIISTTKKDDSEFNAPVGSDRGYLAFPLRSKRDRKSKQVIAYKGKAVFDPTNTQANRQGLTQFELCLIWRGPSSLGRDLDALAGVVGHLGAIGFRSRRSMGALRMVGISMPLINALQHFQKAQEMQQNIKAVWKRPGEDKATEHRHANDCIDTLSRWLQDWRSHGRSIDHPRAQPSKPPHNQGFEPFARNDHDRGIDTGKQRGLPTDVVYRPALGLPIIQFFSSGHPKVDWNETWDQTKARRPSYGGEGRFASPVLLRPHRDDLGRWHALVIFVDAKQWPEGKPVYLNGQARTVSLDLYKAMKEDNALQPFL